MSEIEADEYILNKAKEILSEYKLIYQKLQYGPNRGQYFVYLPMENDISKKYLNGNGCSYAVNGTGKDKEQAFRMMCRVLADCMSSLHKTGKIIMEKNSAFSSMVESYSENIIKPKRGGKYSQAEWSEIRSFFYGMFNSPPVNEKKKQIIEWRTNLIQSLGFDLFKKLFLISSRFKDINDAESNPHNFKSSYPLNSLEIFLSHKINHSNNGVLCKYGDCLFDDATRRTFENVLQNYQEAMSYCETRIDKELEILSNPELYDGSISLDLWNRKYSATNIGSELKAEILRSAYGLAIEKDYDYENAIANYLRNTEGENKPTTKNITREIQETIVWLFEPNDYKSINDEIKFIMHNNNGFTSISSLGSLPPGIIESKYKLAKSWTDSFISRVNFQFDQFGDLNYYQEHKELFQELKSLLEKNEDYTPQEKDLFPEILAHIGDGQQYLFFEDHTSDRFLNEIRKFTSFDEFSRRYSELDLWIDVTDSARLGIIRVEDVISKPRMDESKAINESFYKSLLEHIKSGKGLTPIVVERANTGYYLREGLARLLAYKDLAIEFIPALVYQSHVLSTKREFGNPNQITIEDFLDVTLDGLFRAARDKHPQSLEKKTYVGSYKSFRNTVLNVLIPISVREPWCCRDIHSRDLLNVFNRGKFPDLKSLTNKDLPNLSASQMFELLKLSHPTEYKIKIDRMNLLKEWEKRGKKIFEELGFPTDMNYPYVNVNTGYRSVYTLGHNVNEERENVQWWACAQHNLPMGDIEKGIEILDNEIKRLTDIQVTLINSKTKKVKSQNKDLYSQNAFEINSYERGKLVIAGYLKLSEGDINLKEKEAEAQIMIVNLLKKKLSLDKKKQK